MSDKKFYWLKLKKDFFKRHDMTIIEGMPNGKDYLLFYLKLLVESLDHSGNLRFSETIPYSTEMLSSLTHTNIDVVRSALKVLSGLQLIEVLDDETIFMTEVAKMTGCETAWAEKKREYRLQKKDNVLTIEDKVRTEKDEVRQEIRDKSIDIYNSCATEVAPKPKKYTDEPEYQDFLKIYNIYPKKRGKQSAYATYKKWLYKKKTVDGRKYGLTNVQMWDAVKNYVRFKEEENRRKGKENDITYFYNFDTLMNNLLDWVEEIEE